MAAQGLTERRDARGRTNVFRFAAPTDDRPVKLADNLRTLGEIWQEWEVGIAGNKPAKLWTKAESGKNCTYSRRSPLYYLLDRLVHQKNWLPAEAFRRLQDDFPGYSMGKLAKIIRRRELDGTLHEKYKVGTARAQPRRRALAPVVARTNRNRNRNNMQ